MLAFAKEEYLDRVKKVKNQMAERGIDVMFVTDPANICYLSGYDAWTFYVPQALILSLDEDQPYLLLRDSDVPSARHTAWVDEEHRVGYPDYYIDNTSEHAMDFIAQFMNQKGLVRNKVMGVEKDSYQLTVASMEHLTAGLEDVKAVVDSKRLINWVKLVKSDAEVEAVRIAAKTTHSIFETLYNTIRPGVRQCDVAAAVYAAGARGVGDYAGEYAAAMPFMACGERSDACHLAWTNEPYQEGDVLMFEWAGVYKRYHLPTCRTVAIGEPRLANMRKMSDIVIEALNAAMEVAKPGNLAEDIPLAAAKVYEKYGLSAEGRTRMGYSVGLNYPPDWGEHTISPRIGDKTVLQKNMTFHLRSDNWGLVLDPSEEPFGIHFSEGIVITDTGCEALANVKRELFVAK